MREGEILEINKQAYAAWSAVESSQTADTGSSARSSGGHPWLRRSWCERQLGIDPRSMRRDRSHEPRRARSVHASSRRLADRQLYRLARHGRQSDRPEQHHERGRACQSTRRQRHARLGIRSNERRHRVLADHAVDQAAPLLGSRPPRPPLHCRDDHLPQPGHQPRPTCGAGRLARLAGICTLRQNPSAPLRSSADQHRLSRTTGERRNTVTRMSSKHSRPGNP